MSKMIQLRNVPDALHRSLKARAAMAGMSLSDYLLAEIKEIAERPPWRSCGSVYINASRLRRSSMLLVWCEKGERRDDRPGM